MVKTFERNEIPLSVLLFSCLWLRICLSVVSVVRWLKLPAIYLQFPSATMLPMWCKNMTRALYLFIKDSMLWTFFSFAFYSLNPSTCLKSINKKKKITWKMHRLHFVYIIYALWRFHSYFYVLSHISFSSHCWSSV